MYSRNLSTQTNEDGNRMFGVVSEGVNGLSGLPFAPKDTIHVNVDTIQAPGQFNFA